ncbi:hypothetical protein QJS10_CPA07g00970 [Acorus calamus]|uniref:Uncharacterized protein n=1 Tax=Acorus calamus TaxID=4465 RepID=A0AAV9EFV2_ACOCL|nr:hypothetical protein QJS10_CPA07g00970 [Acorus calamus]
MTEVEERVIPAEEGRRLALGTARRVTERPARLRKLGYYGKTLDRLDETRLWTQRALAGHVAQVSKPLRDVASMHLPSTSDSTPFSPPRVDSHSPNFSRYVLISRGISNFPLPHRLNIQILVGFSRTLVN